MFDDFAKWLEGTEKYYDIHQDDSDLMDGDLEYNKNTDFDGICIVAEYFWYSSKYKSWLWVSINHHMIYFSLTDKASDEYEFDTEMFKSKDVTEEELFQCSLIQELPKGVSQEDLVVLINISKGIRNESYRADV